MSVESGVGGAGTSRLLWIFAGASLLAVLAGCAVLVAAGGGPLSGARNLIAWVVGAMAALAISRRPPSVASAWVVIGAAVIALTATFLNPDRDGVHRWLNLGPLHVNAAALLLPVAVVALTGPGLPLGIVSALSIALAALLLAQPDASQATAFAAAVSMALAQRGAQAGLRWLVMFALLAIAGLSWLRPDPLEPVPEVEEVVGLAWQVAPAAAVAGVLGLLSTALAPLGRRREPGQGPSPAAIGLATYTAIVALAPLVSAFPVPLMGVGMSPIVGLWLGIGLLAAGSRNGSSGQT